MAFSSHGSRVRPPVDLTGLSLPADDADGVPSLADGASDDGAIDEARLRSFILEVSAGRPQGVADATDLQARIDPGADRELRRQWPRRRLRKAVPPAKDREPAPAGSKEADVSSTANPAQSVVHESKAVAPLTVSQSRTREQQATQTAVRSTISKPVVNTGRATRRLGRRRGGVSPWIASSGLNILVIVVLLAGKLPGVEPLDELLWATAPPIEEVAFSEVDFEAVEEDLPVDGEDVAEELIDPGMASFGELETAAALADVSAEATLPAGSIGGDVGALFGESGAGLAKFDAGLGAAPTARFFGQEIEGRRIVFVLDNSGSMQGGRLETVIAELLRCVDSLRDEQEFYVIFHSDTVYPLFYPDPVDRYIRPTAANKRMLARWLDTVELCLGDSVDEALAIAAMIEPDTVFLLSDGRIQGDKKIRFLLDGQARNFPIHTFAVGMGSSGAGRRNLADVAAANNGEFRESDIPDEMRDLARRELRPYHSEKPGPVWGRQVKPFRPRG